jgi:hypothetical protein
LQAHGTNKHQHIQHIQSHHTSAHADQNFTIISWPRPSFPQFKAEVDSVYFEQNDSWMDGEVLVSASLATTQALYGDLAMQLLVSRQK